METVVPSPDPTGLPAPLWLLQFLSILTFVAHLLAMNLLVGGVVLLGVSGLKSKQSAFFEEMNRKLARALPPTMAMTITLGIAPLLFLQVIYGQAFYSASALMAWPWLAIIPMLMIAYYGLYLAQFHPKWLGKGAVWLAWICAVLILGIGFIFSNNATLLLDPAKWSGMYASSPSGLHLNLGEKTLWPRYSHMIGSAIAVGGLGLMLLAGMSKRTDASWAKQAEKFGAKWFVGATVINMLIGFWFLFALPDAIRDRFIGKGQVETIVLWFGVIAALGAMHLATTGKTWLATGATVLTISLMAIVRQLVREQMLKPFLDVSTLEVHPQWTVMAIFAVLLLGGIAVVVWMVRAFMKGQPQSLEG